MKQVGKWVLIGVVIYVAIYTLGYSLIPRYQPIPRARFILDTRTGDLWTIKSSHQLEKLNSMPRSPLQKVFSLGN